MNIFCQNLGIKAPRRVLNKSIKEVLQSMDLRAHFVHNVNPKVLKSIDGELNPIYPDKIIWEKDPKGVVTTKSMLNILSPPAATIRKFHGIWQAWLPPKVSLFLWRILKNSLPTHDNIIKLGLNIVSKCVCCSSSDNESMDHLFIHSDHARYILDILCPLFCKRRPDSIHQLVYDWGTSSSRFSDCMALGIMASCLWDLWKLRNQIIYAGEAGSINKSNILRWAAFYAASIKVPHGQDPLSRRICSFLHVSPNFMDRPDILWWPWCPSPKGNTCNISIMVENDVSRMAAIIRDKAGCLVVAIKVCSSNKPFLRCLYHLYQEILRLNIPITCLRVPNLDIHSLSRESSVEWVLIPIRRRLISLLHGVEVFRVSHSLNRPANALCWAETRYLVSSQFEHLPKSVQLALRFDGANHPCSFKEQQILLWPP